MGLDGYSDPVWMDIEDLDPRPASEMRAKQDEDAVKDYGENFGKMPPIKVAVDRDGKHWTVDGEHRRGGALASGSKKIQCRVKRVEDYTEAFREACHSNNDNRSVRITNADKRAQVYAALGDRIMQGWPNTKIAEWCGVEETMVRRTKSNLPDSAQPNPAGSARDTRTRREKYEEIASVVRDHPDWSNVQIAEHCRVHRDTVAIAREKRGLGPSTNKGGPIRKAKASVNGQVNGKPPPAVSDIPNESANDVDALVESASKFILDRFESLPEDDRAFFAFKLRTLVNALVGRCPNVIDRSRETLN